MCFTAVKLSYNSKCSALNQISINEFVFNSVFLKSESVAGKVKLQIKNITYQSYNVIMHKLLMRILEILKCSIVKQKMLHLFH